MTGIFRWFARIIGSVITLLAVIILFPHVSKWATRYFPDEGGAAIKATAILATKLENSARLETLRVEEDGVLTYDIRAAFIGTVSSVHATYKYEASFGIDLTKVTMQVTGNEIHFTLPQPELLRDSLTPAEVYHDDFWYKGFTFEDYEKLFESERAARRYAYLSGDGKAELWEATVSAFESTIKPWLANLHGTVKLHYLEPASTNE